MEEKPEEGREQPRTNVPSADGPVRRSLFDVPPPEVPGDVFDRQRVMVSWQQKKVAAPVREYLCNILLFIFIIIIIIIICIRAIVPLFIIF
jgi:hypothetical protein